MKSEIFNPFGDMKMNWIPWCAGETSLSSYDVEEGFCLLMDRRTGEVSMQAAKDVPIMSWAWLSGMPWVIAFAHKKDVFNG